MELIPYISTVLVYIVLLLLVVLFISFVVFKKRKEELHEVKIKEHRRYIRTYIENHSREMTASGTTELKTNFTAGRIKTTSVKYRQPPEKQETKLTVSSKEAGEKKRYTILNDSLNEKKTTDRYFWEENKLRNNRARHYIR